MIRPDAVACSTWDASWSRSKSSQARAPFSRYCLALHHPPRIWTDLDPAELLEEDMLCSSERAVTFRPDGDSTAEQPPGAEESEQDLLRFDSAPVLPLCNAKRWPASCSH